MPQELDIKTKREIAKMRICYFLLNRVPEESTGNFASRLLSMLEEEFNYRMVDMKSVAAPDMYEALKGYVMLCGNTAYQVDQEGLKHYWSLAIKALAKAEGK